MRANPDRKRNIKSTFTDCIQPYVRGRNVLHVGCAAHDARKRFDEPWTHEMIGRAANTVVGIDILEDEVAELQDAGYDVRHGDIQNLELDETFEVIVLSEVIEHLTYFDGLMASLDRHLTENGVVVVTTPNILAVRCFGMELLGMDWVNTGHTCYFERATLAQLMDRYGFDVVEWNYSRDCSLTADDPLQSIGWLLEQLLPRRVGCTTLGAVVKRSDSDSERGGR